MTVDHPIVAVCDVGFPPGLAFLRSLGSAGVPTRAYGRHRFGAGRFSRHAKEYAVAPDAVDVAAFHSWIDDAVEHEGIGLIVPTSDYVAYAVAVYDVINDTNLSGVGTVADHHVRDCLFKDTFAARVDELGFPQLAWAAPTSIDEALVEAERIGYPVVLKPKSHVGIGVHRGEIARDPDELRTHFTPYELRPDEPTIAHPGLEYPLLQHQARGRIEVQSVTGHIDAAGEIRGVQVCAKRSQWGGELGVGTWFEVVEDPDYVDEVLDAVRVLLPRGIFEFELLVDRDTGTYWALELNPRGFGQMSLSVARGHDLAAYWYADVSGGTSPTGTDDPDGPTQWCMAVPLLVGLVTKMLVGPDRPRTLRTAWRILRRRRVGAIHSWSDPLPGMVVAGHMLRHPGGLVRPFLRSRGESHLDHDES